MLQQYDHAADSLAQVTGVNAENVEASYWLALSYHALGAEAYGRLQESFPDSWRNHQLQGEGYALRGDLDSALKEFQLALQLKADEPELHETIGEVYLDKHSDDDARKELEAALALDPSRTHSLCLLGRLYVQRRENETAVALPTEGPPASARPGGGQQPVGNRVRAPRPVCRSRSET